MKKDRKSRNLGYFLAELFILILGISASFALNEWRVSNQERKQETELLHSFKANLVTDSLILFNGSRQLETQVEFAQAVLAYNSNQFADSVVIKVLSLLNYVPFNSNDITYQEMKSVGSTRIIRNDSLASALIGIYESDFELVSTWSLIDAEHVRSRLIPYVEENFPFVLGLQYSASNNRIKTQLMDEIQNDQFKHLVQFGLSYKASANAIFKAVLQDIRETISMIDSELESNQRSSDQESISQDPQ